MACERIINTIKISRPGRKNEIDVKPIPFKITNSIKEIINVRVGQRSFLKFISCFSKV